MITPQQADDLAEQAIVAYLDACLPQQLQRDTDHTGGPARARFEQ